MVDRVTVHTYDNAHVLALAGRAGSGMTGSHETLSPPGRVPRPRHPAAYQRRTRNLPPRQGLASLGLRQTLAGAGEPEYGLGLGDGMARWLESDLDVSNRQSAEGVLQDVPFVVDQPEVADRPA